MRTIVENDLPAFCDWLGLTLDPTGAILSGTFTTETLHTDLLVQVGPGQILHAEYIRNPTPDMAARMTGYRAQIMRRHPGESIHQYAIILGKGRLDPGDDPTTGFTLALRTIYLTNSNPTEFLTRPGLAGLAVLGEGDQNTKAQTFLTAIRQIQTLPAHQQTAHLEAATVLATISLDRPTIDQIIKEASMSIESIADFYDGTEVGHELHRRGREEGRQEGREEGRQEGRWEGRGEGAARILTALLRVRFGNHTQIPAIAERLSQLPDEAAVDAITRAAQLSDLILPTQTSPADS